MAIALAILAVLLLLAVIALIMLTIQSRRLRGQFKDVLTQARDRERGAVTKSRVGHVAKITEQLAPLLPGFPDYNVKDVQWVGGVVNMVVWDGLEDGRDVTVVLLDIKTGQASANARQRKVRDAVEAHRVQFRIVPFRPARSVTVPELIGIPAGMGHRVGSASGSVSRCAGG